MWKRTFFTYKRLSKPRDLPYNEGRQTGRRPVCAVCRKSMGGGFLEQIKVRLMESSRRPCLHNPALRGDPGHPVCGGVLAGDGGADPGGGAGDPAVEAPRSRQAAAVPGDGGGVPQRLHQKQHGGPWTGFCPLPGTISLYILLCNIIGIFGLVPPTKDLNVTAALAIMSAVLIYGAQFRYHGLRGGLKKFMEPMPLLLPIN